MIKIEYTSADGSKRWIQVAEGADLVDLPERHQPVGSPMSYDFEAVTDREPPRITTPVAQANDLEAIVMLLELAAIYLTPAPGTEFTLDQLLGQARDIGGDEIAIDEKDALIVLDNASFLKKLAKKRFCLK